MPEPVPDQRGFGKQLKRVLPSGLFRLATRSFNAAAALAPFELRYALASWPRSGKAPYRFIEPGDAVIQVGAPRDLLRAGRSRAIHFARLVGHGTVLVVEPDPANVAALRQALAGRPLAERIQIVPAGAWRKAGQLTFLANPRHPAANVLDDVLELPEPELARRGFERLQVPVDTLDVLWRKSGLAVPRLVSITTNGAELAILEGMTELLAAGCPYISLASTGEGYHDAMHQLGYEYIVRDDRGYLFRRAN